RTARFAAGEAIDAPPSLASDEIGAIGDRFQDMARAVRREMTERLEASAALRTSEDKFRTVMQYSPIGQALVGLDGRFLAVNPAQCDILGYGEEELLRLSFRDITHPDDLQDSEALNARV